MVYQFVGTPGPGRYLLFKITIVLDFLESCSRFAQSPVVQIGPVLCDPTAVPCCRSVSVFASCFVSYARSVAVRPFRGTCSVLLYGAVSSYLLISSGTRKERGDNLVDARVIRTGCTLQGAHERRGPRPAVQPDQQRRLRRAGAQLRLGMLPLREPSPRDPEAETAPPPLPCSESLVQNLSWAEHILNRESIRKTRTSMAVHQQCDYHSQHRVGNPLLLGGVKGWGLGKHNLLSSPTAASLCLTSKNSRL